MNPAKQQKIKREKMPALPPWWQEALDEAKKSSLAQMTEEEIARWTEELAERGKKRQTPQSST